MEVKIIIIWLIIDNNVRFLFVFTYITVAPEEYKEDQLLGNHHSLTIHYT